MWSLNPDGSRPWLKVEPRLTDYQKMCIHLRDHPDDTLAHLQFADFLDESGKSDLAKAVRLKIEFKEIDKADQKNCRDKPWRLGSMLRHEEFVYHKKHISKMLRRLPKFDPWEFKEYDWVQIANISPKIRGHAFIEHWRGDINNLYGYVTGLVNNIDLIQIQIIRTPSPPGHYYEFLRRPRP